MRNQRTGARPDIRGGFEVDRENFLHFLFGWHGLMANENYFGASLLRVHLLQQLDGLGGLAGAW
jgi:hypothetical protein